MVHTRTGHRCDARGKGFLFILIVPNQIYPDESTVMYGGLSLPGIVSMPFHFFFCIFATYPPRLLYIILYFSWFILFLGISASVAAHVSIYNTVKAQVLAGVWVYRERDHGSAHWLVPGRSWKYSHVIDVFIAPIMNVIQT